MSWVYTRIIPKVRKALNANILLVLPHGVSVPQDYQDVLNEHDDIMYIRPFCDLYKEPTNNHISSDTWREMETRYDCNLLSDVLMQERLIAEKMMIGSRTKASKNSENEKSFWLSVCKSYFEIFEKVFNERDVCLSLVWPRSSWEAVIGILSCKRNILVTYPYTSKGEGTLVNWSDGMFANSVEVKKVYLRQKSTDFYDIRNRTEPGRLDSFTHKGLSKHYSLHQFCKRLLLVFVNWSIHLAKDVSKLRYGGRKNPIKSCLDEIYSLMYWKLFLGLCVARPVFDKNMRYGLYTFQNEPEFSVQGRCKEFFNQQAVILSIADAMPADSTLCIKEHAWVGHRTLQYYKELLRHPNIQMLPPTVPAVAAVSNAKFVASLNGTVIFEAAAFGIPAAYFSHRSEFSTLANSVYFSDLLSLKTWVKQNMNNPNSIKKLECQVSAKRYIDAVKEVSFDGAPLYKQGAGKIDSEQIERSFRLLMQKIALFNESPSLFCFK